MQLHLFFPTVETFPEMVIGTIPLFRVESVLITVHLDLPVAAECTRRV